MTYLIIITGLCVALTASLVRNWLQGRAYERLQSRYKQLYEQSEMIATDVNPVQRWVKKPQASDYDPDDYSDLTAAQRQKIGGRS